MTETWLNEGVLLSFDELVRIELGPQIIALDYTTTNLHDNVTAPHYRRGKIDAYGKRIDPDAGGLMHCVDWRAKHVPHIWKIYQLQDVVEVNPIIREEVTVQRFIKVDERLDKDEAIAAARTLRGSM
jgi:hypothetical protein